MDRRSELTPTDVPFGPCTGWPKETQTLFHRAFLYLRNIASPYRLKLLNLNRNGPLQTLAPSPIRWLTGTAPFYYGVCRMSSDGSKRKLDATLCAAHRPIFCRSATGLLEGSEAVNVSHYLDCG